MLRKQSPDYQPDPQPALLPSPSAERMRTLRLRRQRGLRPVTIEVRHSEIDALIMIGLLKPEMRDHAVALVEAIHAHLDVTLSLG